MKSTDFVVLIDVRDAAEEPYEWFAASAAAAPVALFEAASARVCLTHFVGILRARFV